MASLILPKRPFNTFICRKMGILSFNKNKKKDKKEEEEAFSVEGDRLEQEKMIEEKEAEIELKRNKSRLNTQHRNILFGKPPYNTEIVEHHTTLKYKRKLFGRFGNSSGVEPGALWPTTEDLEVSNDYEKVAYPLTIHQMVENALEIKRKEDEYLRQRDKQIAENFSKLDKWKKDVQDRAAKKLSDMAAAKAKRDALIDEVRRHFGYKIDPKDERFKEVLMQKEKEQKKRQKEQRSKDKKEKLLEKLNLVSKE